MDYWFCVSACLCVSVFSRQRHNVQMLRASLSETPGFEISITCSSHRHSPLSRTETLGVLSRAERKCFITKSVYHLNKKQSNTKTAPLHALAVRLGYLLDAFHTMDDGRECIIYRITVQRAPVQQLVDVRVLTDSIIIH